MHIAAQHGQHGFEHELVVGDGDHACGHDRRHRRVVGETGRNHPRTQIAVGHDAGDDGQLGHFRVVLDDQNRGHAFGRHALGRVEHRRRAVQHHRRPAHQRLHGGGHEVVGVEPPRHHLTQTRAVFEFDEVGKGLVVLEEVSKYRLRDQVEQHVLQCLGWKTHPPLAQEAGLAKIAAGGEPVVERAVAAKDLDRTTAHHMPEFGGLAEVDDLLARLVVAHIDSRRDALADLFGQVVKRRVGSEKVEYLELFDLHGFAP